MAERRKKSSKKTEEQTEDYLQDSGSLTATATLDPPESNNPLEEKPPLSTEDTENRAEGSVSLETNNESVEVSNEDAVKAIEDEKVIPLLNCNDFKLLQIHSKGNRKYRVSFTADSLNVQTDYNLKAESTERSAFEKVFDELGQIAIPVVFPDQNLDEISLVKIHRRIVNNKNKEPKEVVIFHIKSAEGFGYDSVSEPVEMHDLGDRFKAQFNELENYLRQEISRKKPEAKQMSLFNVSNEDAQRITGYSEEDEIKEES